MKFNRGVALGTSLVLILAACGNSSSSSRDRNASFAGAECYTKEEFPALKTQATAMSDTYVATAKEVEAAKELATTNLLAWKKSEEETSELVALRKAVADAQVKFEEDSTSADEAEKTYIAALNKYFVNIDPDASFFMNDFVATAISAMNLTNKDRQMTASRSEAKFNELADKLLRELDVRASEIEAKFQTSESSVDAYNALIEKYEAQVAEYKKFTSIKACPVLLSAGDAEDSAESSTTSTTRPTFQFEETPASPAVTIEGAETDETVSSMEETTPSSSSTTSTTVLSSSSTTVPPRSLGQVVVNGTNSVIQFEVLQPPVSLETPTSSSSTLTSTTLPVATVVINTSAVQAFFSNPTLGSVAGAVVVPTSYTTSTGSVVVLGESFLTFQSLLGSTPSGPISSEIAPSISVGPFGTASLYGGGFYSGSEVAMYAGVSKQSLGRLRADKTGNVVGSVKVPEGTQSGPLKLVAFGFNAKKKPIVLPLTINVEVPKAVSTTSTSVVVDTSIAGVESTVVATETDPSDESTTFSWLWIVVLVALVLAVAIFFLLRRKRSKLNDQTL